MKLGGAAGSTQPKRFSPSPRLSLSMLHYPLVIVAHQKIAADNRIARLIVDSYDQTSGGDGGEGRMSEKLGQTPDRPWEARSLKPGPWSIQPA